MIDSLWAGTFFTAAYERDPEEWCRSYREGRAAARYLYRAREKFGAKVLVDKWWGVGAVDCG